MVTRGMLAEIYRGFAASPILSILPLPQSCSMRPSCRDECRELEEAFSSLLLDDMKQRLLRAFRGQTSEEAWLPQLLGSAATSRGRRMVAVQEELRKAQIERDIAWLRVELLEMKSQNHQLAKTLLDLSMEIQRLRNETDLSAALESKTLNVAASPE
ncbi:alanine and arginine-rich domain-containing protein [Tiliqua scincoides]|uniref:alanine and arginine-rich domain-containing protein n=1 Tax=Tiliqua scincoides TaxID=71010 RepID=UPI003462717B